MSRPIQRGSLIICCTATMKIIFTLQSNCCSGLMQQSYSRSQITIKSSHKRVDGGTIIERQIMFLYIAYTLWMHLVHMNACEYTAPHLKFQHCTAYSMHKKWLITSLLGYYCNASEQRTRLQRLMPAVTGLHDACFIICRWRLFYKQSSYTNLLWFQTELPSNIQSQWKWLNRSDLKKKKKVFLFTLSYLRKMPFMCKTGRVCRQNHTTMVWVRLAVLIMLTHLCSMQVSIKCCVTLRLVGMSI